MAEKNSMRHIRVDEGLKEQATQVLAAMEESRAMMASRHATRYLFNSYPRIYHAG